MAQPRHTAGRFISLHGLIQIVPLRFPQNIKTSTCSAEGAAEQQRIIGHLTKLCKQVKVDNLFEVLKSQGNSAVKDIVCCLLQEWAKKKDLQSGMLLQSFLVHAGIDSVEILGNRLIRLFSCCGSLIGANQTFHKVSNPTVYTWSAIISAHANLAQGKTAIYLCSRMQLSGIKSNNFIYLAALKACIMRYALQEGRCMHQETIDAGLQSDVVVGSTLVDMYAKCGSIEESQQVFYQLRNPDLISWNAMIRGYVQNDRGILALNCFEHMQEAGIKPDKVTFPSILKACCSIGAIQQGRLIHNWILRHVNESDVVVGNTLLDMYAKCGSLGESSKVFDRLPYQDMVSFAAMIAGYTEHDEGECALECFVKMQAQEINPDAVTFLSILKACGSIGAIEQGRLVHDQILKFEIKSNVAVRSTLVDMYAKCGSLEESCKVFEELPDRDLVSWDAMLAGFAQHGKGHAALDCFEWMQTEGTKPGSFTLSSILKACGSIGAIENGRFFHVQSLENRFDWDVIVGNTLIDMYSKSGSLEESQKVFDKMVNRNVVSWGELISCYAQHGEDFLALDYYRKMQMENIEPNKLTILAVIKACGKVGAIDQGRSIHEQIVKRGFHQDILMDNSIIDMYVKCGSLEESFSVFERLTDRNVVSWNAMIGGYAQHGEGLQALHCFKKMQKEGIKPDRVTFLCILSACSHAGLVDTGQCYFQHMNENHGITPDMDHYSCMVDLLGRAGYLKEAEDLLQIIEQPGISGWMSLLGACRMHTNREF